MTVFDVAVVGLGAMGSAAAYHLARRGHRVAAFERFEPGHDRGSSHGESRMIRLAYYEHPSYVPLARRAYAGWQELERLTGEGILTPTGILEAGHPGAEIVQGTLAAARLHGLAHDVLDAAGIRRRFPAFELPPGWTGVYQPDAGLLRPERAIALYCAGARAAGAELRTGAKVARVEPAGGGVRVVTDDGCVTEAGAAVLAAGAWTGELVPELKPYLTLTRQTPAWFAPRQPDLCLPDRFPMFIIETEDDVLYGFPDFAGTGVKFGSHRAGAVLADADEMQRRPGGMADEPRLRAGLDRFIPAASGPLIAIKTCMYTYTPDRDFIVDRHPGDPRIVIASACSGHGFKFAPVLGEALADLATEGTSGHDIGRFRLDRLLATASR